MSAQSYTDQGPDPYVVDIERATLSNEKYRTTLWTGAHLQMYAPPEHAHDTVHATQADSDSAEHH